MIGSRMVLLAIACIAVIIPAAAQDNLPPAGRYQLAPGEGSSFVRLDTRTGAVSHCRQQAGVWHCEPIVDSSVRSEIAALADKVDRLSADLDRLTQRVEALTADAAAPVPPAAVRPADNGKPEGFARSVVNQLLEMIRSLKHGRADAT